MRLDLGTWAVRWTTADWIGRQVEIAVGERARMQQIPGQSASDVSIVEVHRHWMEQQCCVRPESKKTRRGDL